MTQCKPLPPVELLRELFDYDPSTGHLTYRVRPRHSKVVIGSVAGSPKSNGYLQVQVTKKNLLVHRVCWKVHFGTEPPVVLDHKNRDVKDNRLANLRAGDYGLNQGNRSTQGRYLPGTWPKHHRWQASTPRQYIGMFDTEEEAHQAYVQWHLSYFGEFSIYAETSSKS